MKLENERKLNTEAREKYDAITLELDTLKKYKD